MMKTRAPTLFASLWVILAMVLTGPVSAQDASFDEEYFLVRTLEVLYEQWPQDVSNSDAFGAAASELRREAIRLRVRGERANVAPEIVARYGELVALLDSYTTFLTNLGVIRKTARDNAEKEGFQSGFAGGYAAGGTFATLRQNDDVTSGEAALASLVVGGITYALDSWGKSSRRDEAERAAVAAAAQKVQDNFTETLERAKQTFQRLGIARKWSPPEVGWELSEAQAKAVLKLYAEGDVAALVREFARQRSSRPRDSYIRLAHNFVQAHQNETDSAALARLAEDSYEARKLIPDDSVYSDYRLGCISQAALIASAARQAERRNGVSNGTSALSRRALELWNEVLRLESADPTGYARFFHSMARLADGDISGSRSEAESVSHLLKEDPDYLYGYACILSLDSDWDRSLQALSAALRSGAVDVNEVRTDPDLTPLSQKRREEFQKLVIPQWTWTITDDWVWDDVIVQNNSIYPLTGVTFTVVLKKGAKIEQLTLRCDSLDPGEKHEWTDAVRGVEGAWDTISISTAALSCDQARK